MKVGKINRGYKEGEGYLNKKGVICLSGVFLANHVLSACALARCHIYIYHGNLLLEEVNVEGDKGSKGPFTSRNSWKM